MTIAVIGATGMVGSEIIKILEKKKTYNNYKILFVATKKNIGKKIIYKKEKHEIISIKKAIKKNPTYALFSAGSKTATKYAPEFSKKGTIVIDNSSAFRMNPAVKLIVPEINANILTKKDKIISNPNCSTIQLVMIISPIHKKYKIKRMVVSTYQAVSGSGHKGVNQLLFEESKKQIKQKAYRKQIYKNIIPHCDDFEPNGYTKEEIKIIKETNKILGSKIKITSTAVRVPTIGGHGESVNIELLKEASKKQIENILKKQKGVVLDTGKRYKTPIETKGKDSVFVSRIRKDQTLKSGFNMWIVADPLRKGAATNATQILKHVISLKN